MVVDDFHGTLEWSNFQSQMHKVFPGGRIEDLPTSHPMFHCFFDIDDLFQIPGVIMFYSGTTYEKDGYNPHFRGVFDENGQLKVMVNFKLRPGRCLGVGRRSLLSREVLFGRLPAWHQLHHLLDDPLARVCHQAFGPTRCRCGVIGAISMDRLFESLFKYRFFLFHEGDLTFDTPVSAWWLLPALTLAGAAAFWVYRRRSSGIQPRWRRQLLIVLRALSLILLLALLFRPSLKVSTHLPRKSRIALLVDGSQSMTLAHDSDRSRWEAALGWLDPGEGSVLADLEERFQLQILRFDRDIRETQADSSLPPQEPAPV